MLGLPFICKAAATDPVDGWKITGLTIRCELDENIYPKAIRVTDEEMATLNIATDTWHPEWNYTISPKPSE